MPARPKFKRVLVKLSGESLCCPGGFGIDPACIAPVVAELASLRKLAVQPAVVIGGGNFIRGRDVLSADDRTRLIRRTTADGMGMLATVINALALRDALEATGVAARVASAFAIPGICEPFERQAAGLYLEQGGILVLAGGTGHPFFSTDMSAALRASELDCQVLIKATKVDGVFDRDPMRHPKARKYDRLTYRKVLTDRLNVMDMPAISLCMENGIPILVCRLGTPGNLSRAVCGRKVGTLVTDAP